MKYLINLIYCLSLAMSLYAQSGTAKTVLQPGDPVPDLYFPQVANSSYTSTRLFEHRGKWVIIGFWSMYCPPCIKNFGNLDSLQHQFGDKLTILLVNIETKKQTAAAIEQFLRKWEERKGQKFTLPTVYNDTAARDLFNCIYAPHYAWITPEGKLLALTGTDEVNAERIAKLLQGDNSRMQAKHDIDYKKPLFARDNLPLEQLQYHSVMLKGYYNGLGDSRYYFRENGRAYGFNIANQSLLTIIEEVAHSLDKDITPKRIVLDAGKGADSTAKASLREELSNSMYSLGTIVPRDQPALLQPTLLQTIVRFTDFELRFEERTVDCYALVRQGRRRHFQTDGSAPVSRLYANENPYLQNGPIGQLVTLLNQVPEIELPVVDRTGLRKPVDLYFNKGLDKLSAITEELERCQLQLRKTKAKMKVLVVSRKAVHSTTPLEQ